MQDAQLYVNEGLLIVDEYEAHNFITPQIAAAARLALNNTKTAIDAFLKYGASIKKISWKSKNDLLVLFAAVVQGVDEFQSKAGPAIVLALQALSAAGVVKIYNPQQLVSRVSLAIHGLAIAVGLVKSRLENIDAPDEPKQEPKLDTEHTPMKITPDEVFTPDSACLLPFPLAYQFARA